MKPIRLKDFTNRINTAKRVRPVLDLRKLNLTHAAPVENDRPFLTFWHDPATGTLMPSLGTAR
ncbi:hypothetical protein [Neptunicoccus sediminis]|uniref:hypothetical protein n=1 Tax=Neptunicoccus sediminis TaxID=1892596 RepID=UPI0012FF75A5|nr:hypothetical protein [Neptunicoccus sediminis]